MADQTNQYLEQLQEYRFSLDEEPWRSTAQMLRSRFEALFPGALDTNYIVTHFKRYVYTLTILCRHLVERGEPQSILEVGTGHPYPLQVGLSALVSNARLVVGEQRSDLPTYLRYAAGGEVPDLSLTTASLNMEMDVWPFDAQIFDVVIIAEAIEHLPTNPLHALREASRVLRKGGIICLTTPNISCLDSVRCILANESPHTFGIFQPAHGIYGHHNHEYVPAEIVSLCNAAGFETAFLTTMEVYGVRYDLRATVELLGQRGLLKDRGHIIFYLGTKQRHDTTSFPSTLYYASP